MIAFAVLCSGARGFDFAHVGVAFAFMKALMPAFFGSSVRALLLLCSSVSGVSSSVLTSSSSSGASMIGTVRKTSCAAMRASDNWLSRTLKISWQFPASENLIHRSMCEESVNTSECRERPCDLQNPKES